MTVDLEGSGYEFLLGDRFGQGLVRESTPATGSTGLIIGAPGNKKGNGFTGTEDVFDTYYPNGAYENSWWFGGYPAYPWATFPGALCGARDPAGSTAYFGIGAGGNDASLYTCGDWSVGSSVDFLLRKNQMAFPGWLSVSLKPGLVYYPPPFDVTLLVKWPFLVSPVPMIPDHIGDFDRLSVSVGPGIAGHSIYFQGAVTALDHLAQIDLSEGVKAD